MFDYRALYEIQLQVSVDFLRVVQFNALKCVVLKLRETLSYIYTLNGHDLNQVHEQRDLGVIISEDLHPRKHMQEITK